jgi:predicted DNA-binding protein YlxM (UPF0122 family)
MAKAKTYSFHESLYTMKELADQFNLSYCRMSNLMHKFNHDADTIYLQRNSDGAKRSGKNPRVFSVDLHKNTRMTVAEIADVTGYSNAAISGKIKRGVTGSDLLKKKKIKPLYSVTLKPEGSTVKKLSGTVVADRQEAWVRQDYEEVTESKGTTDIEDRQQIRNAVDDFLAGGGKIKKLQADGNINGQSWKDQAKKSWSKRKRKLETRKVIVTDEKGTKVDVNDFIKELESQRDQRRAYGEVLHLAATDEQLTDLEHSLPETAFGDSLEKR